MFERGNRSCLQQAVDSEVGAALINKAAVCARSMRQLTACCAVCSVFALPLERPNLAQPSEYEASLARIRDAFDEHAQSAQRGG
jgi:hypothetical protein